jgi:hypothetical protein
MQQPSDGFGGEFLDISIRWLKSLFHHRLNSARTQPNRGEGRRCLPGEHHQRMTADSPHLSSVDVD